MIVCRETPDAELLRAYHSGPPGKRRIVKLGKTRPPRYRLTVLNCACTEHATKTN